MNQQDEDQVEEETLGGCLAIFVLVFILVLLVLGALIAIRSLL